MELQNSYAFFYFGISSHSFNTISKVFTFFYFNNSDCCSGVFSSHRTFAVNQIGQVNYIEAFKMLIDAFNN